jgi:hypothetical protein
MRKLIFLFTAFCLFCPDIFGQDVTFQATSERAVVVGQQFMVNYTLVTRGESGNNIHLPESDAFNNLYGPVLRSQGSSTHIINNRQTTQATFVYGYTLSAKSAGTFTIPPATIRVGNSEYKSNALEIRVLPADQAADAAAANANAGNSGQQGGQSSASAGSSAPEVFVRAQVSKSSVYENEGFVITYKLYTLISIVQIERLNYPEFEGFIAQEIELPENAQWSLENYNGRNYQTAILKQTVLFPQRSGRITIPAGNFDFIARIRTPRRTGSFFDDFFDTTENVRRSTTSTPVTIDVKELPSGRPASFTGAVGDYSMTSSISTNQLQANDAVTVRINITGNGNIRFIRNPNIVFPNDFDVLDPEVSVTARPSPSGVSGTRTVVYNAIPRFAGDFTIPASEFSFFDPRSGTYRTLRTDEFRLNVEPGEAGAGGGPIISASNREDIRFLGQDIRYIKTEPANFHRGDYFFGTFPYWLFYLVPTLLFILFFWIYRNQAAQNANIALVRTKKANKVAAKRLKLAAKYLKENKTESFYDETLKAVWGYLSDKLNIPVSALTKDNVDANLLQYGATESLIKEFRDILDTAEFARFAPAQASGKMDELYDATVQAIDKMENTIKR